MTLIQRRTPQPIMGRVSAAVEVVMATPQAISLALGSLLVVVLSYRQILSIMGVVTLLAAAYIAVLLRSQIASDVRRSVVAPAPVDLDPPAGVSLPASPRLTTGPDTEGTPDRQPELAKNSTVVGGSP